MRMLYLQVTRFLRLLVLLCGMLLPAMMGYAQSQDKKQKHFSVRDGLPFGNVESIAQDLEGFMWIGTRQGLYRHDGYTFAPYRHNADDPRSLADDGV